MSALISDEYLDQLHKMRDPKHMPRWGCGGQRHVRAVYDLVVEHEVATVLDYGCGHGMLLAELRKAVPDTVQMVGYDPGMAQFSALPEPAELVVSTDVLEHIEPDKLDSVLQHVRELTRRVAYLNIHTGPAHAVLPDGRNAHLIQKPAIWWQDTLRDFFASVERVKGFDDRRPSFLCQHG